VSARQNGFVGLLQKGECFWEDYRGNFKIIVRCVNQKQIGYKRRKNKLVVKLK
jgi:hypothetical protein